MENYLERIQKYIENEGLTNTEVEGVMEVSVGVIRKNIKEKSQLNGKALENFLSHYTDVSAEWIMTGRGEMKNKPYPLSFETERVDELEKENQRLELDLSALRVKYNRNNEKLIIAQDHVIGMQEEINKLKKQK